MEKNKLYIALLLMGAGLVCSCSEKGPEPGNGDDEPVTSEGVAEDNGMVPSYSTQMPSWAGGFASDKDKDAVGTNGDFYHELSQFTRKVSVAFNGSSATVTHAVPGLKTYIDGAYVTIDFQTLDLCGIEITLSGSTDDGGIKIYGASKYRLILDGVSIASKKGPAINSQCKKRVFVTLADGTKNTLKDASVYTADPYYLGSGTMDTEDRKGALFAEGDMIFDGKGVLSVSGNNRHGIAGDGYMVVRPGVSLNVDGSAKNCYHFKGDATDGIGIRIMGGIVCGQTASPAGKVLKTDQNIEIEGGQIALRTTGNGSFDPENDDTSSGACLKADSHVTISGGIVEMLAEGTGSKCINAGTFINVTGGEISAVCTGEQYIYSDGLTASSKALKAPAYISISNANMKVLSLGKSDGSRGIESDTSVTISGSTVDIYAYDDAINADDVMIDKGTVLNAYSVNDDGIKGKTALVINDGTVYATGGSAPASGLSCNSTSGFIISGGTVVAIGGALKNRPSTLSKTYQVFEPLSGAKDRKVTLSDGSNADLFTVTLPRTVKDCVLLVSYPGMPTTTLTPGTKASGF